MLKPMLRPLPTLTEGLAPQRFAPRRWTRVNRSAGSKRLASRLAGEPTSSRITPRNTFLTVVAAPTGWVSSSCTGAVPMAKPATRSSTASSSVRATCSASLNSLAPLTAIRPRPAPSMFQRAPTRRAAPPSIARPSSTRRPPAGASPATAAMYGRSVTPPASMAAGPSVADSERKPIGVEHHAGIQPLHLRQSGDGDVAAELERRRTPGEGNRGAGRDGERAGSGRGGETGGQHGLQRGGDGLQRERPQGGQRVDERCDRIVGPGLKTGRIEATGHAQVEAVAHGAHHFADAALQGRTGEAGELIENQRQGARDGGTGQLTEPGGIGIDGKVGAGLRADEDAHAGADVEINGAPAGRCARQSERNAEAGLRRHAGR